jgi:hypothetical protein
MNAVDRHCVSVAMIAASALLLLLPFASFIPTTHAYSVTLPCPNSTGLLSTMKLASNTTYALRDCFVSTSVIETFPGSRLFVPNVITLTSDGSGAVSLENICVQVFGGNTIPLVTFAPTALLPGVNGAAGLLRLRNISFLIQDAVVDWSDFTTTSPDKTNGQCFSLLSMYSVVFDGISMIIANVTMTLTTNYSDTRGIIWSGYTGLTSSNGAANAWRRCSALLKLHSPFVTAGAVSSGLLVNMTNSSVAVAALQSDGLISIFQHSIGGSLRDIHFACTASNISMIGWNHVNDRKFALFYLASDDGVSSATTSGVPPVLAEAVFGPVLADVASSKISIKYVIPMKTAMWGPDDTAFVSLATFRGWGTVGDTNFTLRDNAHVEIRIAIVNTTGSFRHTASVFDNDDASNFSYRMHLTVEDSFVWIAGNFQSGVVALRGNVVSSSAHFARVNCTTSLTGGISGGGSRIAAAVHFPFSDSSDINVDMTDVNFTAMIESGGCVGAVTNLISVAGSPVKHMKILILRSEIRSAISGGGFPIYYVVPLLGGISNPVMFSGAVSVLSDTSSGAPVPWSNISIHILECTVIGVISATVAPGLTYMAVLSAVSLITTSSSLQESSVVIRRSSVVCLEGGVFENVPQSGGDMTATRTKTNATCAVFALDFVADFLKALPPSFSVFLPIPTPNSFETVTLLVENVTVVHLPAAQPLVDIVAIVTLPENCVNSHIHVNDTTATFGWTGSSSFATPSPPSVVATRTQYLAVLITTSTNFINQSSLVVEMVKGVSLLIAVVGNFAVSNNSTLAFRHCTLVVAQSIISAPGEEGTSQFSSPVTLIPISRTTTSMISFPEGSNSQYYDVISLLRGWEPTPPFSIEHSTFRGFSTLLYNNAIVRATNSATLLFSNNSRKLLRLGCNVWDGAAMTASSIGGAPSTTTSSPGYNLRRDVAFPESVFVDAQVNIKCAGFTTRTISAEQLLPRRPVLKPPSAATAVTSGFMGGVAIAHGVVSGVGFAGGVRGMQAALMARRKRALCILDEERSAATSADNSNDGFVDVSFASMCCDAGTSPTQMNIDVGDDGSSLSALLGAIVGNSVLVIALCIARLGLYQTISRQFAGGPSRPTADEKTLEMQWDVDGGHRSRRSRPRDAVKSIVASAVVTLFGHPIGLMAAMWPSYMILLAPAIGTSFGLTLLPQASSGIRVVGAIGICAWAAPWIVCLHGLCWRHRTIHFPFRSIIPKSAVRRHKQGGGVRLYQWLIAPRELLDAPLAARPYARKLLHQYAPVFEGYVARTFWYFNVELCFGFLNGLVMGFAYNDAQRNPCSVWTEWMLVGFGFLEIVLSVVLVRPFSVPLDTVSVLMTVGLSTLSQLIPLVDTSDAASNASDVLGLVCSAIQLLLIVFGVGIAVLTGRNAWRSVHVPQSPRGGGQSEQQRSNVRNHGNVSTHRPSETRSILLDGLPARHKMTPRSVRAREEMLNTLIGMICAERTAKLRTTRRGHDARQIYINTDEMI